MIDNASEPNGTAAAAAVVVSLRPPRAFEHDSQHEGDSGQRSHSGGRQLYLQPLHRTDLSNKSFSSQLLLSCASCTH